jgi:hypothetical protein
MHDAIVMFTTTEPVAGEVYAEQVQIITKVFRLEFESEEDFQTWLMDAELNLATSVEQLAAG